MRHGVEFMTAELPREEARPSRCVHHEAHAHSLLGVVWPDEAQHDPVRLEGRVEGAVLLEHFRAGPFRVAQEDLVEGRPRHLEGLG